MMGTILYILIFVVIAVTGIFLLWLLYCWIEWRVWCKDHPEMRNTAYWKDKEFVPGYKK